MASVVEKIRKFVSAPSPRFKGNRPGADIVSLLHAMNPAATAGELELLSNHSRLASPELLELYSWANGGRLFVNLADEDECFFFAPVGEMESEKEGLAPWILPRTEEPGYVYNSRPRAG